MKLRNLMVLVSLIALPAVAQQPYAAPDADLWRQMKDAFATLSMPLSAHHQVQQILQNVEQQARVKAAQAESERKAKQPAPEKKK